MKKTYYIKGMHCIACEIIIEKEFEDIKGLKIESLTHKTGKIVLEFDDEKAIDEVKKILKKNKYSLLDERNESKEENIVKNTIMDYIIIALLFVVFGLVYLLFDSSDLIKLLPNSSADISIFSAFFIGIGSSLSTCLAMLGGIVVGFSTEKNGESKSFYEKIRLQFSFHFGRVLSFIILGGLLGKLGSLFIISPKINGFIAIFIGIIIFYIGLNLLNIVPSISKLGIYLPKSITKKLNKNNNYGPFVIGILTFFIPCGFTQAMQIASIASGSFMKGAMIMGIFALGTMPVLLGLGLLSSYSKDKNYGILKKIIGVIIIIFALIGIKNSSNLLSFSTNNKTNVEIASTGSISIDNNTQKISVSHNGYGVDPSEIKIKSFKKYKLTILPTSNGLGCFTTITIPGVDESVYNIKKGKKITFNIPALPSGKYKLVCTAMGMTQGTLVVE